MVGFQPEPAERPSLEADNRIYVPPGSGGNGWLALDFTAADVDRQGIAELVVSSYRQIALRRMLMELYARGT